MLKLYIEMNIADLIAKVVRATGDISGVSGNQSNSRSQGTEMHPSNGRKRNTFFQSSRDRYRLDDEDGRHHDGHSAYAHQFVAHSTQDDCDQDYKPGEITKTVETTVSVSHRICDEDAISDSSTSQLKQGRCETVDRVV